MKSVLVNAIFRLHYSTSSGKVFQDGERRIRRGLAQTADRRVHHRLRQLLQQRGVPPLLLHQLEGLDRADAAWRALAAGFVGEELHQVARGARTPCRGSKDTTIAADPMKQPYSIQGVEIERDIRHRRGQNSARRSARQIPVQLMPVEHAAADIRRPVPAA